MDIVVANATRLCYTKAGKSLGIVKDTNGQYLSIGVPKRETVDESKGTYISSLNLMNMTHWGEDDSEKTIDLNIE